MNISKNITKIIKRNKMLNIFLGALAGGVLGFLYYYFIGCSGNSCPITSSPYASILFGVILGLLITIK